MEKQEAWKYSKDRVFWGKHRQIMIDTSVEAEFGGLRCRHGMQTWDGWFEDHVCIAVRLSCPVDQGQAIEDSGENTSMGVTIPKKFVLPSNSYPIGQTFHCCCEGMLWGNKATDTGLDGACQSYFPTVPHPQAERRWYHRPPLFQEKLLTLLWNSKSCHYK